MELNRPLPQLIILFSSCYNSFIKKAFYFILEWAAKGFNHTHTCIHSPPDSPPVQPITEHWAEFPVLCRALLVIHLKCSSVYMPIPSFLTIPSSNLLPRPMQVCSLSLWETVLLKSGREREIAYDIPYMQNLKRYLDIFDRNELQKTQTDSQTFY